MSDATQKAMKDIEAAKVLRGQIGALVDGDPEFIRDTLEGEIDFESIVRSLLASIGEDEAMLSGLKVYIDDLTGRKERIANRIGLKRSLIAAAIEIADRPKIELDVGTISLTKTQPKALVSEEADIPAEFWKPQPPKLDLKALGAALKEGREIPGATLSNGGATVTIRRK